MPTSTRPPLVLLTVPQAAERLQVHRGTVYQLVARGELDATDVSTGKGAYGRPKTRIREDVLDAFIERRTRNARRLRVVPAIRGTGR